MPRELKYVERCSGANHNDEAWIAYVDTSKSGRTVYFNQKAFIRASGLVTGNHLDVDDHAEFWISGVKKRGSNRHWAGSGKILIERTAVSEYLQLTGLPSLDETRFEIVDPFPPVDEAEFHEYFNRPWANDEPDDAV